MLRHRGRDVAFDGDAGAGRRWPRTSGDPMAQSLVNPNLIAGSVERPVALRAGGSRRWYAVADRRGAWRIACEAAALAVASALTVWSAVAVKQGGRGPTLMAVSGAAITVGDGATASDFGV